MADHKHSVQETDDSKEHFLNRREVIENTCHPIFNSHTLNHLVAYDETYIEIILEQWKTAVEFSKDISIRRLSMNGLFMTGLSILVSGILFSNENIKLSDTQYYIIIITVCICGIILCNLWVRQLNYYSTLIKVKYDAIKQLEKYLPALILNYEDIYFYNRIDDAKSFSKIEKYIPMLFGVVFLIILVVFAVPVLKEIIETLL